MSAFNKVNIFVQNVARGVHNLHTNTLKIALTNTAPTAATTQLSGITQISTGNGYVAGGNTVGNTSATQSSGTLALTGDNVVFEATGSVGPFRYAVIYDDTAANKPVIGWWDYGSSITLANGETFTVNFGANILTLQ